MDFHACAVGSEPDDGPVRIEADPRPAGLPRSAGRVDHVTGLPTRVQFLADLERRGKPADAAAAGSCVVLATLADARHFNEILRALGHTYADAFVCAGAARIGALLPPQIVLYHVSVLSFAVVVPNAAAVALAERLARGFRAPVTCSGIPIVTRLGIGIAETGAGGGAPAEALRAALAAAQDSRREARGWARYDCRSDAAHRRAFTLLSDLRGALAADDQLALAFQPKVDLRTGRCHGAEALIRWQHPALGPISPAEFVPLAEATALIGPLTDWVVGEATRHAAAWQREAAGVRIAINVSPNNLLRGDFIERLQRRLRRRDLPASAVALEFTEGTLAASDRVVLHQFEAARAAGFEIAIDDFGTGYSNISYLARLPANVLKIDQSFVRPLAGDEKSQVLVRSMIGMAHDLGYRVVAEGIETRESLDLLTSWGCDEGQGYLLSRPLAPELFLHWWRQQI